MFTSPVFVIQLVCRATLFFKLTSLSMIINFVLRLAQRFLALESALQLKKILQLTKIGWLEKHQRCFCAIFFVGVEDQIYLVASFIVYLVIISSSLFLPLLSRLTSFLIWGSIVAVDLYFEGFYYSYVVLAFFCF